MAITTSGQNCWKNPLNSQGAVTRTWTNNIASMISAA